QLAPIIADSTPRAANNSKVSVFITLRPRWKVSFVATKLLLSQVAATQPARRRCSFPRAQQKCCWSLGEIILPTRCRTIFHVGCKPAITSRFSATPRSVRCPAGKVETNRTGKYQDSRTSRRADAGRVFHDRRETLHRVVTTGNRARCQRIHQNRDERRRRTSLAGEQTPTHSARNQLPGNLRRW